MFCWLKDTFSFLSKPYLHTSVNTLSRPVFYPASKCLRVHLSFVTQSCWHKFAVFLEFFWNFRLVSIHILVAIKDLMLNGQTHHGFQVFQPSFRTRASSLTILFEYNHLALLWNHTCQPFWTGINFQLFDTFVKLVEESLRFPLNELLNDLVGSAKEVNEFFIWDEEQSGEWVAFVVHKDGKTSSNSVWVLIHLL